MSRLRGSAARLARLVTLAGVLMAHVSFAQAPPSQDRFAALHANLMGAADQTLADALADRPWRNAVRVDADTERQEASARIQRLSTAAPRLQQLRPLIEPVLREEGVPAELSAVVLVESGGLARALSPKGARGVWQFMPGTARRYGLAVSDERDERIEVVKSTRAAAHYLRDLYQQFGDWRLAFAAYNAGEQVVQTARARSGQRDYAAIQRFLPVETRNYVPAVLDAMRLFGGGLNPQQVRMSGSARKIVLYARAQSSE